MKTNYHTHTFLCKHATGSVKDYVLSAINKNLSILGFSDHAPYKDENYSLRMDFCQLDGYLKDIETLKETYANKIIIKSGLEIEYSPKQKAYYKELLSNYCIDYLVLGQHFFIDKDNNLLNSYCLTNSSQYIDYANSVIEGMKTGYFKFLAHPDVVFVNDLPWDKNCEKCCDIIVSCAKENDFILEFNANGIRKGLNYYNDGYRYSYPYKKFWEKVAKENIKVVINSDCHNPEEIWDSYVDEAYTMAKNLNLNIVTKIF